MMKSKINFNRGRSYETPALEFISDMELEVLCVSTDVTVDDWQYDDQPLTF